MHDQTTGTTKAYVQKEDDTKYDDEQDDDIFAQIIDSLNLRNLELTTSPFQHRCKTTSLLSARVLSGTP